MGCRSKSKWRRSMAYDGSLGEEAVMGGGVVGGGGGGRGQ